jgi:hypothetical protein
MASALELLNLAQLANSLIKNGNAVVGTATVTPSAANTPTGLAITYPALTGTTFFGFVTANTGVPGTTVTGVSIINVTATGATVIVTRTNTTATILNYLIIGLP